MTARMTECSGRISEQIKHARRDMDILRSLAAIGVSLQSRLLLQQAASFLTAPQLATLTRIEHQKLEGQRRAVESLRNDSANTDSTTSSRTTVTFTASQASETPDTPQP